MTKLEAKTLNHRELAWIGDAILSLHVRSWLLSLNLSDHRRGDLFKELTSNQFLSSFSEPTRWEARIGRKYVEGDLHQALKFIDDHMGSAMKNRL